VNERIRAREIRLIGADGEQLGVVTPEEGRARADEEGYDLVEVAPNASPPVCRIMDYGKYKYEQKKKAAAGKAKGKGRAAALKEVKMRPSTDDHDLAFKLKNARRFLMDGDKVKVTVMFRGREMAHRRNGYAKLDQVKELLGELVSMENPPQTLGKKLPSRQRSPKAEREVRMPKMKTHRGAAKRFKKTGTGKLKHQKQGKRHILTKMSSKRKRHLREEGEVSSADRPRLKQMVPYL
jgi:translation initiation factor IF-3